MQKAHRLCRQSKARRSTVPGAHFYPPAVPFNAQPKAIMAPNVLDDPLEPLHSPLARASLQMVHTLLAHPGLRHQPGVTKHPQVP